MRALIALLVVTACACDPVARVERDLSKARAEGAEVLAPSELSRAEAALSEAKIREGDERARLLLEARRAAEEAAGRARRLRARVESAHQTLASTQAQRELAIEDYAHGIVEGAAEGRRERAEPPAGARALAARAAWEKAFASDAMLLDVRPVAEARAVGAVTASGPRLAHTRWPKDKDLLLLAAGDRDLAEAVAVLRGRGYRRLFVVDGGFAAWQREGLPVVTAGAAGTDVPVVEASELVRMLSEGAVIPVDVRAAPWFSAGHIPGAVNVELAALVEAAGRQLAGRAVVVYGTDDEAGRRAAQRLTEAGHRETRRLLGGVVAWVRAGQRLERAPSNVQLALQRRRAPAKTDREGGR